LPLLQEIWWTENSLANLQRRLGNSDEADRRYRRAIDIGRKILAAERQPDWMLSLAKATGNLAMHLSETGDFDEAEQRFQESVDLLSELAATYPLVPAYQTTLAHYLGTRATLRQRRDQFDESAKDLERAIQIITPVTQLYPDEPGHQSTLYSCKFKLGNAWNHLDRAGDAKVELLASVRGLESLVDQYPDIVKYKNLLADAHTNLSITYKLLSDAERSLEHLERALAIRLDMAEKFPEQIAVNTSAAGNLCNHGNYLNREERPREALERFHQAKKILEKVLSIQPDRVSARKFMRNCWIGEATSYMKLRDYAGALQAVEQAEAIDDAGTATRDLSKTKLICQSHLAPATAYEGIAAFVRDKTAENAELYFAATIYSTLSTTLPNDVQREAAAASSLDLLRRAKEAGYFSDPGNVQRLKAEPAFVALTSRAAYREFVTGLSGQSFHP
jgi:tetratricopeptide (TPR) repeat protein